MELHLNNRRRLRSYRAGSDTPLDAPLQIAEVELILARGAQHIVHQRALAGYELPQYFGLLFVDRFQRRLNDGVELTLREGELGAVDKQCDKRFQCTAHSFVRG